MDVLPLCGYVVLHVSLSVGIHKGLVPANPLQMLKFADANLPHINRYLPIHYKYRFVLSVFSL